MLIGTRTRPLASAGTTTATTRTTTAVTITASTDPLPLTSESILKMEDQVQRLVDRAWLKFQATPRDKRLLIGIAGIPGSGKTTLARIIAQRLNDYARASSCSSSSSLSSSPEPAIFLPMDGFHLTRAALSAMPDPVNAHFRRGAAFTFDAPKFLSLIRSLRRPLLSTATITTSTTSSFSSPTTTTTTTTTTIASSSTTISPTPVSPSTSPSSVSSPPPESSSSSPPHTHPVTSPILAPSFDHALKDPKENDIAILPHHRIIVAEGLYLALDQPVWRDAASLFDELWFVRVTPETARARLAARHVRAGIARDLEEGDRRATESDLVNGEEILRFRLPVHELVESFEDEAWV